MGERFCKPNAREGKRARWRSPQRNLPRTQTDLRTTGEREGFVVGGFQVVNLGAGFKVTDYVLRCGGA